MDWRVRSDGAALAGGDAAPVRSHDSLKARAYDALVLDIIVGDYPSSGRLDEASLAKKHDVGLAGVRDALNRLSLEGLVLRQPRFGTVVAPIEIHEVQEALEARSLLEPYIARRAAGQADPQQMKRMTSALEAAGEGVRRGDYRMVVHNGRLFYGAMGEAGGNAHLLRALLNLYTFASRLWIRGLPYRDRQDQLGDIERHVRLAAAIERCDPDGAQASVEAIIAALRQSVHHSMGMGSSRN